MGTKRKLNPLAAALVLVDQLSDEEQRTLLDYLRQKHKAPRKSTKKADKGPKAVPNSQGESEQKTA